MLGLRSLSLRQEVHANRVCRQPHGRHLKAKIVRSVVAHDTEENKAGAQVELDPESEIVRKRLEAERLRAAEKFLVVGGGNATCTSCGYEYKQEKGDPEYPVAPGMKFTEIPEDYNCPICGAPKDKFRARATVVAGFAENQKYGLGTNSMTGDQKLLLIYGSLAAFFIIFLLGYALE